MTLEDIIIKALIAHGYSENDIIDYEDAEYFVTYSPLSIDKNTMSCMIFKETGVLKLLNGTISRKVGDNIISETTCTLSTWLRAIGKMDLYIAYICYKNNITKMNFINYTEYLETYLLKLAKYNSKFEEYRKIFYKNYILDKDIFGVSSAIFEVSRQAPVKIEKTKSEMTVRKELSEIEKNAIDKYIKNRKLAILNNDRFYGVVVERNGYNKPAIAFDYGNGFVKYRFIFSTDKKYRFLCSGRMNGLYEVRNNKSDICYLVEGESEGITISQYISDDIYCLHNTNSLPSETVIKEVLGKYSKIIVKIDKDRYEENKKAFDKIKKLGYNIYVDYKVEDILEDFNSLHIKDKLSKEDIEIINNKEE